MVNVHALGPSRCADCGESITRGYPVAFEFGSALVSPDGEKTGRQYLAMCEVPGLRRCDSCNRLVMADELVSAITPSVAFQYVTETYMPRLRLRFGVAGNPVRLDDALLKALDEAAMAASTLARELISNGPMILDNAAPSVVPGTVEDDQEGATCDHVVDPRAMLASIRVDDNGATYTCPHCGDRHDVGELFEPDYLELFSGIRDSGKD